MESPLAVSSSSSKSCRVATIDGSRAASARLQPTDFIAARSARRVATIELLVSTTTNAILHHSIPPPLQLSTEMTCPFPAVPYYLVCFHSQLSSVVEQRFCKPSVVGSNPTAGSNSSTYDCRRM